VGCWSVETGPDLVPGPQHTSTNHSNRFAFHDWLTLRYGWFDLTYRPCGVAFQVATVLHEICDQTHTLARC
jgi:hypothetical protein